MGRNSDSSEARAVSIIVPTLNREQVLCDTLQGLLAQDYPHVEILLVDQTSSHDPDTEQFLRRAARQAHVRHIRTSTSGVTHARNLGIEKARGEILLFCDDDVFVRPDWATRHAMNYDDPTIGGVTGQVLEPDQSPADIGPVGRVTPCGRFVGNFNSTRRVDVQHVKGGNMSFRKEAVKQAGCFDPRFSSPAFMEEADLAFRVRRLRYRIVFDPSAVVRHRAWPRGGHQTRTLDDVSRYYHFIRFKTLFILRNMSRWSFLCSLSLCVGRAMLTGLMTAKSPRAFYRLALKAPWDGYWLYRRGRPT